MGCGTNSRNNNNTKTPKKDSGIKYYEFFNQINKGKTLLLFENYIVDGEALKKAFPEAGTFIDSCIGMEISRYTHGEVIPETGGVASLTLFQHIKEYVIGTLSHMYSERLFFSVDANSSQPQDEYWQITKKQPITELLTLIRFERAGMKTGQY